MNRLNWTLVLVPLALVGLLACQGAAFGDDMDLPLAPLPSGVTAAAYAPPVPAAPAVPSVTVTTPGMGCDEGCGCGCGCDRHWIVGIEALWLAPIGNQRCAGFQVDGHDAIVADTCIQEEMTFTPRITFGWQGECWGLQVKYFQLHQNDPSNGYNCSESIGGVGALQEAAVRCEKFDLEATRLFCYGETQFQWAGGVCYGQFDQTASLSVLVPGSGSFYNGWSMSKLAFHGVGLTTGLTALRPIGCKNLNLFCSVQTSLLWDNCANTELQVRSTYDDADASLDGVGQSNSSLFIGEVEVGLQWMAPLKCVPADAFFRVSFDYQYWNTTDAAGINLAAGSGPEHGPVGYAFGSTGNGSTNLVGFGISTGITW